MSWFRRATGLNILNASEKSTTGERVYDEALNETKLKLKQKIYTTSAKLLDKVKIHFNDAEKYNTSLRENANYIARIAPTKSNRNRLREKYGTKRFNKDYSLCVKSRDTVMNFKIDIAKVFLYAAYINKIDSEKRNDNDISEINTIVSNAKSLFDNSKCKYERTDSDINILYSEVKIPQNTPQNTPQNISQNTSQNIPHEFHEPQALGGKRTTRRHKRHNRKTRKH